MIKAIIFDFYGVVCNEIGSPWYEKILSEETRDYLHEKYDKPSNLGVITEEEFFDGIGKAVDSSGEEVRNEWLRIAHINQELIDFIKDLKPKYQIALCSNTQPQLLRDLFKGNKLDNVFDVVVSSSEVGKIKPNQDIFEHTLKELGVSPEEAVFVDDREVNLKAAKAVGIESILFTDIEKFKVELATIINIP